MINRFGVLIAAILSFSILVNAVSGKKTHSHTVKGKRHKVAQQSKKVSKESPGQLDLSSELATSVNEIKSEAKALRPADTKKVKSKKRQIVRVESSPAEAVSVPDGIQWDHNRQKEDRGVRQLQNEIDKDGGRPSE